MKNFISFIFIALMVISCDSSKDKSKETPEESKKKDLQVPSFNGGNAYQYIQSQVDFLPEYRIQQLMPKRKNI
ncbi:hypothetical protein ABWH96_00330 [Marivirga tractuosa]|uniref:hypothetical protein n=1 Tax=Marivirga tractuosa TaxID=1006 RepID=UPI0035D0D78F